MADLTELTSGDRTDYVSKETREEFLELADIAVVEESALAEDSQTEFMSYAFPTSTDTMSDEELLRKMKDALTSESSDIQVYQLLVDGETPTRIEVQRHPNGMSAYARA